MIYTVGNILDCPEKVIVHGCNNYGVMGSGVAIQIRNKWPFVYKTYKLVYDTEGLSLGSIIPVQTADNKIIINAITQDGFGRTGMKYVSYDAVEQCFIKINEYAQQSNIDKIAMPLIGAGLGGGNWKIIEAIINATASNYTPVVYKFEPSNSI